MSQHIDVDRILVYIDEAEQLNIKPRIGDSLYLDLLKYYDPNFEGNIPEEYKTLMNGGTYERVISDVCREIRMETKYFKGLKTTLEYYVYAKLVKNNVNNLTRFGYTQKENQYSSSIELKQRLVAEKDALAVADLYMDECIEYLKSNHEKIPLFRFGKARNRLNIKIIGK